MRRKLLVRRHVQFLPSHRIASVSLKCATNPVKCSISVKCCKNAPQTPRASPCPVSAAASHRIRICKTLLKPCKMLRTSVKCANSSCAATPSFRRSVASHRPCLHHAPAVQRAAGSGCAARPRLRRTALTARARRAGAPRSLRTLPVCVPTGQCGPPTSRRPAVHTRVAHEYGQLSGDTNVPAPVKMI